MEKIAEGFIKRALNLRNSMNKAKKMVSTIPKQMSAPKVSVPKPDAGLPKKTSNAMKLTQMGKTWGDI